MIEIKTNYQCSKYALTFHHSCARFRFLIWGVRSGKTKSGAFEFCKGALACANKLSWVVAPTYLHLQVAEREILSLLHDLDVIVAQNRARHEITLVNGALIQMRSADWVDNLRGSTVDGVMWIDEAAFMKVEGWWILRERVATTGAEVIITTTPKGRNWVWVECQKSGMPADAAIGDYSNGFDRFVSHHATWDFPWVPKDELADARSSMPNWVYEQEFGAKFITQESQVFRNIEACLSMENLERDREVMYVMGVDLARYMDFTAVIVMDGRGKVTVIDRWNHIEWSVQKERIVQIAKEWNAAIVIDRSNVGSSIEEDLRNSGLQVHGVDFNAAQVKEDLIRELQIAFEKKSLRIPDARSKFAPQAAKLLIDEISSYEIKLTRGGKVGYSSPKGLHDDFVCALALAQHGRKRGLAGMSDIQSIDVVVGKEEFEKIEVDREIKSLMSRKRSRMFNNANKREFREREKVGIWR